LRRERISLALEVNDFNALRISLASPEQTRSWSYGEVTKPETINYRTLKPEKDGLFCEKIFGPTKDFECYCGKYKRVRYKGIVCDKCGVEVTRTKVRRERMGHVELASPVAHIWFVKGTPSRIGLLLDVSPRNLERILYFAQFLVTSINEDVRQKALEALREEMDEIAAAKEQDYAERISAVETSAAEAIVNLETQREEKLVAVDADYDKKAASLQQKAEALEQDIARMADKPSTKKLALDADFVIAERYSPLPRNASRRLQSELRKRLKALEKERAKRKVETEKAAASEVGKRREAATAELDPLRKAIMEERDAAQAEYQDLIESLEEIKDPVRDDQCTLLPEQKLRELLDRYPDLLKAGMGAEAVMGVLGRLDLDALAVKLRAEIQDFSGQRRKKATKRLRVVEAFRKSGSKPEWMVLGLLPVLPPDLRPMVQLDGGRFATSDLNDLYRRVINRNNRLKRLLELGAPEIIIRNEKRMLQEAVDSLIDNGRRGRAVSTAGNHKLKSLSDMLKGKQGRFRQNLLGKRVDYSGRSVIVVGPELALNQCGVPKRMALELFKPFVMHALVARNLAHNIKSAKRIVERARPEVWDILDDIIKDRPVLLNRAPTLHRLGIQAFEPVLIEGSAIQIHPLVCTAFNADFDGDQMAVHVPLSRAAVAEARQVMLSTQNLLLPSSGEPVVAPTLDIVFGCYYLTDIKKGAKGEFKPDNGASFEATYGSFDEARMAHDMGHVDLRARIRVRDARTEGHIVETTVGRIIFDEVLPEELDFRNQIMDKKSLKDLVSEASLKLDSVGTAQMVDRMKNVGFAYATKSGITIAMNDLKVPEKKEELLSTADRSIDEIEDQYNLGLITDEERYSQAVTIWRDTTDEMQSLIQESLDEYGGVYLMAVSGAKGNISQISQMAGMRGLMSDPAGRIIDLPIRSSFREGLTVLEYFISTHGARKGLADTALRTADSGYLTRRLIDVAQDVIVLQDDCGTTAGIWVGEPLEKGLFESLQERIFGRWAAADIAHPDTGEIIVERNTEITKEAADAIVEARIERVYVRSALTCLTKRGICSPCYGRDLARSRLVEHGEAVGIIAAQSIGEPGTQLTMRTFHTGGVAGIDITSGLPRVEELFEARVPKGTALISEIDGLAEITSEGDTRLIKVVSAEIYRDDYAPPEGIKMLVKDGEDVEQGTALAEVPQPKPKKGDKQALVPPEQILARTGGKVAVVGKRKIKSLSVTYEERDEREYSVPATSRLRIQDGDQVHAGQALTDGPLNPQDILRIQGPEAVQIYLVEEVQKVYRSQGVTINDKHIEVIVRQMLRRVRVDSPGDSALLPGELVDRFRFESVNAKALAEGGEPATAQPVLLGVTKASLNTDSFLAAASFQETARVLTEAAINGSVDHLLGLKENVIIGKLIPARAQIVVAERPKTALLALPPELISGNGETPSAPGLTQAASPDKTSTKEADKNEGDEEQPTDESSADDVEAKEVADKDETEPEEEQPADEAAVASVENPSDSETETQPED
jgi:DNA-directed RNA polymerase subunit beta'